MRKDLIDQADPESLEITVKDLQDRVAELEQQLLRVRSLDEIASSLGIQVGGSLVLPTDQDVTDPTDSGFTGFFASGSPKTFGSIEYLWGLVKSGAMQVGSNTDSQFLAGGAKVGIDEDGVSILTNELSLTTDKNKIKFLQAFGGNQMGEIAVYELAASDDHFLRLIAEDENNVLNGAIVLYAYDDSGVLISGLVLSSRLGYAELTGGLKIDYADASGNVYSGSWTPTVYNTSNIDSTALESGFFFRVGNMVTCWGRIAIDITSAGAFSFEMSLPIAATFAGTAQCAGTLGRIDGDFYYYGGGFIHAGTANNRALVQGSDIQLTQVTHFFHFSYQI